MKATDNFELTGRVVKDAEGGEYAKVRGELHRDGEMATYIIEVPYLGLEAATLHEFRAAGGEVQMWEQFNRDFSL